MLRTTKLFLTLTIVAGPIAAAADPTDATTTVDLKLTTDEPKPATTEEPKKPEPEPAKQVAALEPRPAEEQHVDQVVPKPPVDRGTPRFELSGGVFVQSRGLGFISDPNADLPPSYPASNLTGFQVAAALYPLPIQKGNGKLSGLGFSFKIAKSAGATLGAADEETIGDYPIDYTSYEVGAHYRYPLDQVSIDGEIAYGSSSHTITGLPDTIDIPDTAFQYIAAGIHVDVFAGDSATLGFGAKYMSVLSTGDVGSDLSYGQGQAAGVVVDAAVSIPLPGHLFVRGGLEYRKFWIDFDGTGDLSDFYGASSMTDTAVTASANVGVQF